MMYSVALFFKEKVPLLWDLIEKVNSILFGLRYRKKIIEASDFCSQKDYHSFISNRYYFVPLKNIQAEFVADFFVSQPKEAFKYFEPHPFDVKSIKKMQTNKAFLAYLLMDNTNGAIAGYCFIRSFFHGKGFRGRMVGINYRGAGLATKMNIFLNMIGFRIGLRLFETVSRDNEASYYSAIHASKVSVIKELPSNELLLEILPN